MNRLTHNTVDAISDSATSSASNGDLVYTVYIKDHQNEQLPYYQKILGKYFTIKVNQDIECMRGGRSPKK